MKYSRLKMHRIAWMFLVIMLSLLAFALAPQFMEIRGELLIGINVTVAVAGLVIGLIVIRRVNQRLLHLADVARALEMGDYSARSPVTGSDSIALLSRTINSMAARIQSSIRELETQQQDIVTSRELLAGQNARLEEQFRCQAALGEFLQALNAVDINAIAEKTLDYLMREADLQLGLFYLCDKTTGRLSCIAQKGIDSKALADLASGANEGLPARVAAERRWLTIRDVDEDALPAVGLGFSSGSLTSILGIPVLFQQKVLGVLILAALHRIEEGAGRIIGSAMGALGNALNSAVTYKTVQQQALQLEQANVELMEADQLRSEFVANMSHELRTPLNSIIGFSGLLLKNRQGTLSNSDLDYAEKINRNGRHLLSLINDILDLSKIEAGRMDLSTAPVRLDILTEEVLDMLKPQAEEKRLALHLEIAEGIPTVETDSEKIRRVIINLVGNALKFTQDGGITVQLVPEGHERILIQVRDTGIGIPEDRIETIFQPFRQVDSSTSREFGGTGLGLTISRSIVEMLGGEISVASKVGGGSTFTVALPVKGEGTETNARGIENGALSGLCEEVAASCMRFQGGMMPVHGATVLVVDDDPDSRELLTGHIESMGAKVLACSDGEQALRLAVEYRPDLITLDLMMPGMDGWEVLRRLRENPQTRAIPVIIISIVANRRQALVLGAVDALTKPISNDQFQELLQRYVCRQSANKVLIVDGGDETCRFLTSLLEGKVAEIRSASDSREALMILEKFLPDLVFLDLDMPQMDSLSFLRILRADRRLRRLPVVVLAGRSMSAGDRRELERRVAGWIEKDDCLESRLQEVLLHVR